MDAAPPAVYYDTADSTLFQDVHDFALGDLDADGDVDGDLDVFYSSNKTGTSTGLGAIGLLFNDGSGTLATPVRIDTTAPSQGAVSPAVGGWDGGGALDLAGAHLFGNTWTLVEGDGNGGFSTRFVPNGLDYVIDVQSGDLNGDGIEELLFIQEHGLTLDVWRNDGQGAFAAPPTTAFAAPGFFVDAERMEVADLEGDGDLDAVAATTSFSSGEISILRNNGDGTFGAAQLIAVSPGPGSIRLGDLNGDGLVDIGWGDRGFPGELHTVLATGPASFGAVSDWPLFGYDIGDFAFLGLGNDGDLDLAMVTDDPSASGQFMTPLTLALNDGAGGFGAPYTHDLSDQGDRIAVADSNGSPSFQGVSALVGGIVRRSAYGGPGEHFRSSAGEHVQDRSAVVRWNPCTGHRAALRSGHGRGRGRRCLRALAVGLALRVRGLFAGLAV